MFERPRHTSLRHCLVLAVPEAKCTGAQAGIRAQSGVLVLCCAVQCSAVQSLRSLLPTFSYATVHLWMLVVRGEAAASVVDLDCSCHHLDVASDPLLATAPSRARAFASSSDNSSKNDELRPPLQAPSTSSSRITDDHSSTPRRGGCLWRWHVTAIHPADPCQ